MEYDVVTNLITSVGFPIFCVIALGFFIYMSYNRMTEENKNREEKLYTMLGKSQEQLDRLEDVNAEFVSVLNQFKQDNSDIKNDLEYIKETLNKLPKRKTDEEAK